MKTILYNTVTQEVKHHAENGKYKVRGKEKEPEAPWVQLDYINTLSPTITANQRLEFEWEADLDTKEYIKVWTIINKSQHELDMEAWKHPDYAKRLDIDESVINDLPGMAARFLIKGFPIEETPTGYSVWINTIRPQDITGFNGLKTQGKLTEVDRPIP